MIRTYVNMTVFNNSKCVNWRKVLAIFWDVCILWSITTYNLPNGNTFPIWNPDSIEPNCSWKGDHYFLPANFPHQFTIVGTNWLFRSQLIDLKVVLLPRSSEFSFHCLLIRNELESFPKLYLMKGYNMQINIFCYNWFCLFGNVWVPICSCIICKILGGKECWGLYFVFLYHNILCYFHKNRGEKKAPSTISALFICR